MKFTWIQRLGVIALIAILAPLAQAQDSDFEQRLEEMEKKLDRVLQRMEQMMGEAPATMPQAEPPRVTAKAQVRTSSSAFLGVTLKDSDDNKVIIESISEDSPAAEFGLLVDDQIVEMDGTPIQGYGDFVSRIRACKPGDEIMLRIARGETDLILNPVLAEREMTFQVESEDGIHIELVEGESGETIILPADEEHDDILEVVPGIWAMSAGSNATLVLNPDGTITVRVQELQRKEDYTFMATRELKADSIADFKEKFPEEAKKYGIGDKPLEFKLLGNGDWSTWRRPGAVLEGLREKFPPELEEDNTFEWEFEHESKEAPQHKVIKRFIHKAQKDGSADSEQETEESIEESVDESTDREESPEQMRKRLRELLDKLEKEENR